MTNPQKKMFKVLALIPRHDKSGEEWFMKVGSGYENRDGSINLYLNAVPCTPTVKLQIRELDERDLAQREAYRSTNGAGGDRGTGSAASRAAASYPMELPGSGASGEALPF